MKDKYSRCWPTVMENQILKMLAYRNGKPRRKNSSWGSSHKKKHLQLKENSTYSTQPNGMLMVKIVNKL